MLTSANCLMAFTGTDQHRELGNVLQPRRQKVPVDMEVVEVGQSTTMEKWTPKIGQHDKCLLGSSRHPGSRFVIDAVRRAPIKQLVPFPGIVEGAIQGR